MFLSKVLLISVLIVVFAVNSLARPEEEQEASKGVNAADDPALEKTSAEAIGERIMEEMNSMKEKFDSALNKIGEEITKNENEQNEAKMKE